NYLDEMSRYMAKAGYEVVRAKKKTKIQRWSGPTPKGKNLMLGPYASLTSPTAQSVRVAETAAPA
ncbi:hypothetical protein MKW92_052258, partial [Papaver armeniacum]